MSAGTACACGGRARGRWVVRVRRGNYSAFNGYRFTPSAYSEVSCLDCAARWRTTAAYVAELPTKPYTGADDHGRPLTSDSSASDLDA